MIFKIGKPENSVHIGFVITFLIDGIRQIDLASICEEDLETINIVVTDPYLKQTNTPFHIWLDYRTRTHPQKNTLKVFFCDNNGGDLVELSQEEAEILDQIIWRR